MWKLEFLPDDGFVVIPFPAQNVKRILWIKTNPCSGTEQGLFV
jgi:hypothetical protein